eukprot:3408407-Pleurochrysis_carterae.AAC.1
MQLWELDAHCSEIGRSGCANGFQVPTYDWAVVKNERNWRLVHAWSPCHLPATPCSMAYAVLATIA